MLNSKRNSKKMPDGSNRKPGIYKITSPSGKVYIGQSWHIPYRLTSYKCSKKSNQPKLKASVDKYGWDAHSFEIVNSLPWDTTQEILDVYEQLFMDSYRSAGVELLNVREAGSRGLHRPESIEKMSKSMTGKRMGRIPWNKGAKGQISYETREKIKEARKRQVLPVWTDERRFKARADAILRHMLGGLNKNIN